MIYINSRGVKWFLHSRVVILPRNHVTARSYFFRREKGEDYLSELPPIYTVKETKNGLPIVKKL